ncbi:MAG: hypothetical protein BM560_16445 [Roseobacter sp. MedPE-SWde]|nr:MAG: hypothetical protein BM560_16445 [Roseobacter sp. MedPE-SWde]
MTKLALFGAGGKMGMRLGANLAKSEEFETMHVEVSEAGQAAVRTAYGVDCVDVALDGADIIVLAVLDIPSIWPRPFRPHHLNSGSSFRPLCR